MSLIQLIDALLPQTQCGKCGHPGCKPYAQGIVDGEPINKCPPGGDETIAALAELLKVPVLELDVSRGAAPPVCRDRPSRSAPRVSRMVSSTTFTELPAAAVV